LIRLVFMIAIAIGLVISYSEAGIASDDVNITAVIVFVLLLLMFFVLLAKLLGVKGKVKDRGSDATTDDFPFL